jgi:hypothetical protein
MSSEVACQAVALCEGLETSLNINSKRFLDSARNDNKDQTDFMSNSPNHNCAHLAGILSKAKDLAHEAWDTLDEKRDPTSYERFLAVLGMTLREIL